MVLYFLFTFIWVPGILVSLAIILAAFGWTIGLRQFYIKLLLKLFEISKQKIDIYHPNNDESSSDSDSESEKNGNDYKHSEGDNLRVKLIERQTKIHTSRKIPNVRDLQTMQSEFQLEDSMHFCKTAIESIIEDEVTQRFTSSELSSWNLMTRTNTHYQHLSLKVTALWLLGGLLRHIVLMPLRLCILTVGLCLLVLSTAIVGYLPDPRWRTWANHYFSIMSCRVITRAFGAVIRFHNPENKAKPGGICVANHTSPIDVIILQNDNTYAMIGQRHGGLMGIIQRALSRASDHIWFERSVGRDRIAVTNRLKEHVADSTKLPVLIFPEGTCINNTSVMMFKKGSFEVGGTIYPVAIKYDPRFADCFWNSSKYSMVSHLIMLLTSWAIVADVWYLPPEHQREGETSIAYANRIKALIAQKGGLVDLEWDGGLKREKPKESLKQLQQDIYTFSKQLKAE